MNSAFANEQARAVIERPGIKSATDDAQRIRRLYLILFARLPDKEETAAGLAFLNNRPTQRLQLYAQGLMMTNEFLFVD